MKQKRIKVYSLTTTYPESIYSKKPKFIHLINKELVKLGIDVKTLTLHSKGSLRTEVMDSVLIRRFKYLPENYEFNSSAIPDEINRSKIGYLKTIIMVLFFTSFAFFECKKEKPDAFHAHWSFPCGFIVYLMSLIFKKKFIVTIHGGEIPFLKKFNFIKKIVVKALNKSEIVCANSNYSKNEFIKMGVKKNKIIKVNVPPGFVKHTSDLEFLNNFRRKFAGPQKKIVLFCGRLVEQKGAEYLIKAIKDLKINNVHLIIVGDGGQYAALQDLIRSLGLNDKVFFFGLASNEELGWLHDISDVFVCPSIVDSRGSTECLGLVIPEAMESGLPVIATSVGGIIDIIKNEINGLLVPQKDSLSIARAIERIIAANDLKKKIVENSKITVGEFSPQKIAQKYFEIFKTSVNTCAL